jgi:hypothetical protein
MLEVNHFVFVVEQFNLTFVLDCDNMNNAREILGNFFIGNGDLMLYKHLALANVRLIP